MKKYILIGCFTTCVVAFILFLLNRNHELKEQLTESDRNVETLINGQKQYKINDSLNASKVKALEMSQKDAAKYITDLEKQIKQLDGHSKEKVISYTEVTKHDTLVFPITDTVYVKGDTCFGYNDHYISFVYCGDSAYIESQDTIRQVISKSYKHKFLWWKFGSNGINQHIWSTNPRSRIVFDKFVEFKE